MYISVSEPSSTSLRPISNWGTFVNIGETKSGKLYISTYTLLADNNIAIVDNSWLLLFVKGDHNEIIQLICQALNAR